MTEFRIGDKVRIQAEPDYWPACTRFRLMGAEGTVSRWFDWPEVMDPFREFIHVKLDKVSGEGKSYEGATMLFHDHTLERIED